MSKKALDSTVINPTNIIQPVLRQSDLDEIAELTTSLYFLSSGSSPTTENSSDSFNEENNSPKKQPKFKFSPNYFSDDDDDEELKFLVSRGLKETSPQHRIISRASSSSTEFFFEEDEDDFAKDEDSDLYDFGKPSIIVTNDRRRDYRDYFNRGGREQPKKSGWENKSEKNTGQSDGGVKRKFLHRSHSNPLSLLPSKKKTRYATQENNSRPQTPLPFTFPSLDQTWNFSDDLDPFNFEPITTNNSVCRPIPLKSTNSRISPTSTFKNAQNKRTRQSLSLPVVHYAR